MPTHFETHSDWLQFDHEHLWHPYTSMRNPLPCYPAVGADGVQVKLATGQTLIDGMSSWWCALHGYNHPALKKAAIQQLETMPHFMFGGIAHQPAAELGARLIDITPDAFQHIFLADSGSIAIEVAMKMALQYWQSGSQKHRQTFLTIRGGYHGDPFTCMSVGDPDNGQHYLFPRAIAKNHYVPSPEVAFDQPWDDNDIAPLENALKHHHENLAAIIVEPIVQGAGGMWFYHPEYLRLTRNLCDEYGILLIFDEIATGFGRTGKMFAMEHAEVTPDIVCVGKALTGGMMTLAATLTTKNVAMTISEGETPVLMHGPTFMGNPLACSVACASIDLLCGTHPETPYREGWAHKITALEKTMQALKTVQAHHAVADVRVLGGIGVIEMNAPVDVAKFQAYFVEQGVWIRPFSNLIYIMPPYIITEDQLSHLCKTMISAIETLCP